MAMPEKDKEKTMPHVIVKVWPGKTAQQKTRLAGAIAKDVIEVRVGGIRGGHIAGLGRESRHT
jgi:hypothetical protein